MSFPETLISTPIVGLEDLQRAAFYVLFEGVNNAISQMEQYWAPRDLIFDQRVGTTIAPVVIERIPNSNFHEGMKPSLIKGIPENYPNVAVFALRADPAPESDRFDQIDSWFDQLLVEVMVKGDNEDVTNRRIHRTTEAVVLTIRRNPTLGGAAYVMPTPPSVTISDISAVRSPSQGGAYEGQGGSGSRYIWQGSSITFRVQKDSSIPSDGAATFAESSNTDYGAFIDQG